MREAARRSELASSRTLSIVETWLERVTGARCKWGVTVMRIQGALFGAMLLASTMFVSVAQATPEPSAVPESWELSLAPSLPMRIQVNLGSGVRTYWYILYTVTNNTSQDVDFHPEVARVSEIESEVPADEATSMPEKASRISVEPAIVGLHPKVFAAIKRRHAKTHPFLVEPVKAITRLRVGKDNALTSVIVFPDLNPRVSKFTVYFGGLSGERVIKRNPAYRSLQATGGGKAKAAGGQDEKNPKFFVLRKTLAMPYTLPGDERTRRYATPALGRMGWVMR